MGLTKQGWGVRLSPCTLVGFALLLGIIAGVLYVRFASLAAANTTTLSDFGVFRMVGGMVLRGDGIDAYYSQIFRPMQEGLTGTGAFMPWTYPPPYNLVVAPFALLPASVAQIIFTTATLALFMVVLIAISGSKAVLLTTLFSPVFVVNIGAGQNGFLTAGIIGAACVCFMNARPCGGVSLGLMVIKPHLALTLGVFAVARRSRLRDSIIAVATGASLCGLATYLMGVNVWTGFFHAVVEAKENLINGEYRLYRMISPFAAARTMGASAALAMAIQVLVASSAIVAVYVASRKSGKTRQALGLCAASSVLISPYVYDYDLLAYCVGLALLLPEVEVSATRFERWTLFFLTFMVSSIGLAQSRWRVIELDGTLPTLAGFAVAGCFLILCRIVWLSPPASTTSTEIRQIT